MTHARTTPALQRPSPLTLGLIPVLVLGVVMGLPGTTPSAQAAPGDSLLSEDFEDGVADGWSTTTTNWAVVDDGTGNHVYRTAYSDGGSTSTYAAAGDTTWTDYAVSAEIINTGSDNVVALRGRYADPDNNYYLALDVKNDKVILGLRSGGVSTQLDSFETTLSPNVTYQLTLTLQGDQLTGSLDDTVVVTATDTTRFAGRIAVGGYTKNTFNVDDVEVTDLRPAPEGDRYVTPNGAGSKDGSSWANAFAGDQPGGLQSAWQATGSDSTLYVGSGTYTAVQSLIMSTGGVSITEMKTLTGADTGGGLPTFVGDFTLENQVVRQLIDVPVGISYWAVRDIQIESYYYGILARGQNVGIRIDNVDVTDSSDSIFIWGVPNGSTADPATASHDIVITGGDYINYTKSAVRFQYGVYLAAIIDSRADGGGADNYLYGGFPLGFRVGASGAPAQYREHEIVFQDVVSSNNYHAPSPENYWNGDGFTVERQAYNITFVRTAAFDSTDGGYDDKGSHSAYVDTIAFNNKRNYRVWSNVDGAMGAQFFGAISGHSINHGGTGSAAGLWVGGTTGIADLYNSTFVNNVGPELLLEDAVRADLFDSILAKTLTAGSLVGGTTPDVVTLHDTAEYVVGVQGVDPQFVDPTDADWQGGTDSFDSVLYGTTKGYNHEAEYDTPYSISLSTPAIELEPHESVTVTATVVDGAGTPVPDADRLVWVSNAADVARVTTSRGPQTTLEGLTAGTTELVAIYKGERIQVDVTVGETAHDEIRPLTTLVAPASAGPFQTLAIQLEATDDVGLNRIVANIYSGEMLVESTQTTVNGATSGTHTATVTLPSGNYTIRYNASDLAGNIAATRTFDVNIDDTGQAVKAGLGFPTTTTMEWH